MTGATSTALYLHPRINFMSRNRNQVFRFICARFAIQLADWPTYGLSLGQASLVAEEIAMLHDRGSGPQEAGAALYDDAQLPSQPVCGASAAPALPAFAQRGGGWTDDGLVCRPVSSRAIRQVSSFRMSSFIVNLQLENIAGDPTEFAHQPQEAPG